MENKTAIQSYAAILFDMDGVIIDTHDAVTRFWNDIAAENGVHLTAADFQDFIYGRPAEYTLDRYFPAYTGPGRDVFFRRLRDYEMNLAYQEVHGAVRLLRALNAAGIPAGLVTSGEQWKTGIVLGQLGILDVFATQVTAAQIRRGKPDPECYLLGAKGLGVAPKRCIVFEDSISGIQAAVAAGMLCVGVQGRSPVDGLVAQGAHCVVRDLAAVSVASGKLNLALSGGGTQVFRFG